MASNNGLALLTALLLAGCTVGPDFQKPAAPAVGTYTEEALRPTSQMLQPGADIPADWWTLLHAPALDLWCSRPWLAIRICSPPTPHCAWRWKA